MSNIAITKILLMSLIIFIMVKAKSKYRIYIQEAFIKYILYWGER